MEAQHQKQVELQENNEEKQNTIVANEQKQDSSNEEQNQGIPKSQQDVIYQIAQITIQSNKNHLNPHEDKTLQNQQQQHTLKTTTLNQNHIVKFSQNLPEHQYIQSIQEIKNILKNKQLNQITFIQKILRDFSPFVFNNFNGKIFKQSQKKQQDSSDSDVSFQSSGQRKVGKKQKQSLSKENIDQTTITIDQDFFNTQWLDHLWQNQLLMNMIKHNAIFHCRIAFVAYVLTSTKYSFQKAYNIQLSKSLSQMKQKITAKNIRYSFDTDLWTTQRESNLRKQVKSKEFNEKNSVIHSQLYKDQLFSKIHNFYIKLGFMDSNHPFNKKMKILNQQMYRLRYMKEFSYYSFQNTDQVFKYLKTQKSQRFKNLEFYSNKIKITSRLLNLRDIYLNQATNYQWLERSHDYIQWLFPNHFRSQFNGRSYPLGYVQAQIFKNDRQLQQLLLKSFEIFIDFMGCKIIKSTVPNNKLNPIKIEIVAQEQKRAVQRLEDCLIYNTHNHLRIMRILACLLVTGLRKYADAFLIFLNSLKNNRNIDFSKIKYALQKNWSIYSTSPQKKQKALQMCFIPYENFPCIDFDQSNLVKPHQIKYQTVQIENDHGKKKPKLITNQNIENKE